MASGASTSSPIISQFGVTAGSWVVGYKSVYYGYSAAQNNAGMDAGSVDTTDILLNNGSAASLAQGWGQLSRSGTTVLFDIAVEQTETQPSLSDVTTFFNVLRIVNNTSGTTKEFLASAFSDNTDFGVSNGYNRYRLSIPSGADVDIDDNDSLTVTLRTS